MPVLCLFAHPLLHVFLCAPARINLPQMTHGFSFRHEMPKHALLQNTLPLLFIISTSLLYVGLSQIIHLMFGFLLCLSATQSVYHYCACISHYTLNQPTTLLNPCGGGGIRTHVAYKGSCFPSMCNWPLCDSTKV